MTRTAFRVAVAAFWVGAAAGGIGILAAMIALGLVARYVQ
jgi:hypothetical protein